jgi:chitin synthase
MKNDTSDTKDTKSAVKPTSSSRKIWIGVVWSFTWWIPTLLLTSCGMKLAAVQIAWREKVASCFLIAFACGALLFLVVGLPALICPIEPVYSPGEVSLYASPSQPSKAKVSMYGRVMRMDDEMASHLDFGVEGEAGWKGYLGTDVSDLFFPVDHFAQFCPGLPNPSTAWDNLAERTERYYHRRQNPAEPGTYINYITFMNQFAIGRLVHAWPNIQAAASRTKKLVVLYNNVYDVTRYDDARPKFLGEALSSIFNNNIGKDITHQFEQLKKVDHDTALYLGCMNHLFYQGQIDTRDSAQCQASNYTLLAVTSVIVGLMLVKFLSSLQCKTSMEPVDQSFAHKVIMMVPCYTEGLESLQKTLDSLAASKWEAKNKLVFVICDGMVTGSGNDRPTPRIVLDLLGVDAQDEPPFAYESISHQRVNYARVYSGLYSLQGELVPFVVVVKVGCPWEQVKQGNRGKRDSQILLLRFLQRCFDASVGQSSMNPLELELLHHFTNIIGIDPLEFGYLLTIDADTRVEPHALQQLVSSMQSDGKIMGLCGETKVDNEGASVWSSIQVFEYWVSHHLGKSFESLFGTVTCLPGCFSLFRIKADTGRPIIISSQIVQEYASLAIDTLHRKNLYLLGEDRYLTTLLLKHFPHLKLSFTQSATAWTVVPETWSVLLSQRRRWINSTVHNLIELLSLKDLCGCFLFSMRFVVCMDLISTITQPAGFGYLIYLLYSVFTASSALPLISLILLACIYGLQMLLLIFKREWSMLVYSVFYLLALPIYAVVLPLYSFWHFDDFSWGNTRKVMGNKVVVDVTDISVDVGTLVPLVPSKMWAEYVGMKMKEQMVPLIYQELPKWNPKTRSNVYFNGLEYYQPERPRMIIPRPVSAASISSLATRPYQTRPQSFAGLTHPQAESLGRPSSVGVSDTTDAVTFDIIGRMPSDERLLEEIGHIVKAALRRGEDLSKRMVREALADEFFGIDLSGKSVWLNRVIGEELNRSVRANFSLV